VANLKKAIENPEESGMTKDEREKYELNLLQFFKFFYDKCGNIL